MWISKQVSNTPNLQFSKTSESRIVFLFFLQSLPVVATLIGQKIQVKLLQPPWATGGGHFPLITRTTAQDPKQPLAQRAEIRAMEN